MSFMAIRLDSTFSANHSRRRPAVCFHEKTSASTNSNMFSEKHSSESSTNSGFASIGFDLASGEIALPSFSEAQWWARRDRSLPERLLIVSMLCDSVVIVYALLTAFWLRFYTPLNQVGVPYGTTTLHGYSGYIACGTISLVLALLYFQIYDRQNLLRFRHVALQMTKATLLWFVSFLSLALMFKFQPAVSRVFVVISAANVIVSLLLWRWAFHRFLHASSLAASLRQRVLFVGWNEEAQRLAGSFKADPESPLNVVGCISASGSARCASEFEPHVPILGEQGDLAGIIRQHAVDMVILTDVDCVKGEIVGLANLCEKEMVQFKVIPSYFQILVSGLRLQTVNGIPVLGVWRARARSDFQHYHETRRRCRRRPDRSGDLVRQSSRFSAHWSIWNHPGRFFTVSAAWDATASRFTSSKSAACAWMLKKRPARVGRRKTIPAG